MEWRWKLEAMFQIGEIKLKLDGRNSLKLDHEIAEFDWNWMEETIIGLLNGGGGRLIGLYYKYSTV